MFLYWWIIVYCVCSCTTVLYSMESSLFFSINFYFMENFRSFPLPYSLNKSSFIFHYFVHNKQFSFLSQYLLLSMTFSFLYHYLIFYVQFSVFSHCPVFYMKYSLPHSLFSLYFWVCWLAVISCIREWSHASCCLDSR